MLRSILFFIVFNLMMGLQGNTDNAAHIGGLLAGIIIGYIYYPGISRRAPMARQVVTTIFIVVGLIAIAAATLHFI
jgi:rhomboid protease GluP